MSFVSNFVVMAVKVGRSNIPCREFVKCKSNLRRKTEIFDLQNYVPVLFNELTLYVERRNGVSNFTGEGVCRKNIR
jgi:hypothetical protein